MHLVDGLAGEEAKAAAKCTASLLSQKWKHAYSEMCEYVCSHMALSLVRTTSLMMQGVQDGQAHLRHPVGEDGAGVAF